MSAMWAEAWTLPELGSFALLHGTIPGTVSVTDPATGMGRGSVKVPANWTGLNSLLSSTGGSLIRVCRRTAAGVRQVVFEFTPEVSVTSYGEDQDKIVTLSGLSIEAKLDAAAVLTFDWPTDPSIDRDWVWGYTNLLTGANSGFELNPYALTNPGAELGTTEGWPTTGTRHEAIAPDTFEAIEDGAAADDGSWYFNITADVGEGVFQDFNRPLVENKTYIVSCRLFVPVGKTVRMEVTPAKTVSTGSLFNGAAYADAVGNGAWQSVTVTFVADDGSIGSGISVLSQTIAATFRLDTVRAEGFGLGTDDWSVRGGNDVFSVVPSTTVPSPPVHGGSFSLAWHSTSGVLGQDSLYLPVSTPIGTEVTASLWVYHTEGVTETFRLVLRIPGVNPNTQNVASVAKEIPTATWTQIVASGVTTTAVTEIELRYDETGVSANNVYIDDAEYYTGQAPATIGEIVAALLTDVQTTHAAEASDLDVALLTWLKADFSATVDSNAVAWDADLSMTIPAFLSFGQVMDRVARLGYEWRIVPNPSWPGDTESHLLQIFNAWSPSTYAGGSGTDLSATVHITTGQAVIAGPVKRTELSRTVAFSMDDAGNLSVSRDATGETNWGQRIQGARETHIVGDSLQPVATQIITDRAQPVTASEIDIVEGQFDPYLDFSPGDTITFGLPPDVASASRRVAAFKYTIGNPALEWSIDFDRTVYTGLSGTVQAVDRLLRRAADPDIEQPDITVAAGPDKPAPPDDTYTVAPSNGRPETRAVADYKCSGVNDEIEIMTAAARALTVAGGGRVLLYAGTFAITADLTIDETDILLEGVGPGTVLETQSAAANVIISGARSQLAKCKVTEASC